MQPRIEQLAEKKLAGKRMNMSLANNKTRELWSSFMPVRKEVPYSLGTDLYGVQVYNAAYFQEFTPNAPFEKWAAVEVTRLEKLPSGLEALTIPAGLYAVFLHKGSSTDNSTYVYIFTTWLPQSDYILDHRPHFEVLGSRYKNGDPSSEEEIWIPVKLRTPGYRP